MWLGAACGGDKAPACDLRAVKARLAAAPASPKVHFRGQLPPRVLGVDGNGRAPGAVHLRFIPGPEVQVQVGENPPRIAGELGSTAAVVGELKQALATAGEKMVEIETFADLSPVPLHAVLAELDRAVEVHLIVDQLTAPPRSGVAPWAVELFDGMLKLPGNRRVPELNQAMRRAAGDACFSAMETTAARASIGAKDIDVLRGVLPDALAACGCKGADVATTAWLYELVIFPTYQPGWLRFQLDTGGLRLAGMRTAGEIAGALETMTADERRKGVWLVPEDAP